MPRMTTIRKYLLMTVGIVAAIFVLLVGASWLWLATLDLQAHRTAIETRLSQMLARTIRIEGPMRLSASVFPSVSIANVHIANPDWAAQPDFLLVKQFKLEFNPWELLRGRLEIRDIELIGATIQLQYGREQAATWKFVSGNTLGGSPKLIPDIVVLHAKDVLILYYSADRKPISVSLDELQASLVRDEPVTISVKGKTGDVPLEIDLQGGTLAGLFEPGKRWPFKGTLNTDVREVEFEGALNDISTLSGLELKISSEKQQQRESVILGRRITPLFDHFQLNFRISKDAGNYVTKLSGDLSGFDLSRLYEESQRQWKPSVKIREFKIEAQGSGNTLSDITQSITFEATGSDIDFQYPLKRPIPIFHSVRVDSLHAESKGGGGAELLAQVTVNDVPLQLRASSQYVLYNLWQHRDVPLVLAVKGKAVSAQFNGRITELLKQVAFDGKLSMKAADLKTIGALIRQTWPESAAVVAASPVSFSDQTLTCAAIRGQLGSQAIDGQFSLRFDNGYDLSLKAHTDRFDLHDVTRQHQLPANLVFGLNDLNLDIEGKSDSFRQSLLGGTWQVSAKRGRFDWKSKTGKAGGTSKDGYQFALHNIRADTHGTEPITLVAQTLFNGVQINLDAQAGQIEEILDKAQPYPVKLHVSGTGLSASLAGAVSKPLADAAFTGDLDLKGQLPAIGQLFQAKLSREQSVDLHGHLAIAHDDVKLTDVVARTDGIVVNGELIYQAAKSPSLMITSTGSRIDVAPYLEKKARPDQNAVIAKSPNARIVPDVALDFSNQRWLDAVVTVKDLAITDKDTPITQINARFIAHNGIFRLDPLQSQSAINGSTSQAKIVLDSTSEPPTGKLELQANNFNFGETIKRLGITQEITGTLALQMEAAGKGKSLPELVGATNGKIQIIADKGSIPKWALEIWGGGLLRMIIPTTWAEDSAANLNCAVGRFDLTDGIMRSQTLLADTQRVTVAGEVIVNWKNEEITGLFKPQPKDPTLFHLGTPIKLSGTLANPKVGSANSGIVSVGKWAIGLTSPAALIVVFGDVGTKEKNPCAALLKTATPP